MTVSRGSRPEGEAVWVFDFPMPENIANARMHWRVKLKAKKEYFAQLDWLQDLGQIAPPPFVPLTQVRATAVMRLGAAMDDDNAMHRAYKWPLDWLKTRGYLVDDKRKYVRCAVPEQYVKRDGNYGVQITLEPAG